jgi:uncharacterized protein YuzE
MEFVGLTKTDLVKVMNNSVFKYDKISDTLNVIFAENKDVTGIELNENVLLRLNLKKKSAIGLTLFNYSILTKKTEIGFRSLPLTELNDLPIDIRKTVVKILLTKPVSEFLSLSAYSPTEVESIPITSFSSRLLEKRAA